MKKIGKHLSSLALVLAMVLSFCLPAFATSTPTKGTSAVQANSTSTATINVATGNANDTLNAYKVVEVTLDEASNKLDMEFTETFQAFLTATNNRMTVADYAKLTSSGAWDGKDYVGESGAELRELLGAFSAYVKSNDVTVDYTTTTNDNGVAAFNNVAMGQYIILGAGNSQGALIYQTVTAEVVPFVNESENRYDIYPSYDVTMKTSKPSIDKNITAGDVKDDTLDNNKADTGDKHDKHQATANIGDTLTYTLKVAVPTYPEGATNKTFYIGDTLSKGLKLNAGSIVVKGYTSVDDKTGVILGTSDAYTTDTSAVADNGGKFYVDFKIDEIKSYMFVTVEYTAVITEEASLGTITGNPNDVDLIYSNSPFDGNTWEPGEDRPDHTEGYGHDEDKEIVYTYALAIDKYEEKMPGEKLAGATFEIHKQKDCKDEAIATIITDENGVAHYEGLAAGTYYLKETKAPAGYNLMDAPVEITIDSTSTPHTVTVTKETTDYVYTSNPDEAEVQPAVQAETRYGEKLYLTNDGIVTTENTGIPAYVKTTTTKKWTEEVTEIGESDTANGYYVAGVENSKGAHLPTTGGIGTTIFYIVGGCLMIGAAILLITKKRMTAKESVHE